MNTAYPARLAAALLLALLGPTAHAANVDQNAIVALSLIHI